MIRSMNKHVTQLNLRTANSPAADVWHGFFFFTADNERALT
jgi:hypothetical protein